MRVSDDDRDEYRRMRDLDDQEQAARRALIDEYLAIPASGLARAVVESDGFVAMVALRRINTLLREHGFEGPLGARGVEDVLTHMGEIQFHEDELPLLLNLVGFADDGVHFQQPEYQAVIQRIRDAAAG